MVLHSRVYTTYLGLDIAVYTGKEVADNGRELCAELGIFE
jgi:hypothetical protein